MCEFCGEKKEIKSINFCGNAKLRMVGNEIDVHGDGKSMKMLRRIYNPCFRIMYCPMCGKKLDDGE